MANSSAIAGCVLPGNIQHKRAARSAALQGIKKAETLGLCYLMRCALAGKNYLPWCSLDTVSCLRPFLRRIESTRRPLAVVIRSRKPCLLTLFLLCGWNVLFIFWIYLICYYFIQFISTCIYRNNMRIRRIFILSLNPKTHNHRIWVQN